MYCSKCGAKIADNSIFCKECGAKVTRETIQQVEKKNKKRTILFALLFILLFAVGMGIFYVVNCLHREKEKSEEQGNFQETMNEVPEALEEKAKDNPVLETERTYEETMEEQPKMEEVLIEDVVENEKVPVSLLNLARVEKNGKFYYHGKTVPDTVYDSNWRDITTDGYIPYATDSTGTEHENGFHLDGPDAGPYYVEFSLNGDYSEFTARIAPSVDCRSDDGAKNYSKQIEIYLDGELVYNSPELGASSFPEKVELNVEGVQSIRIQYAATNGSNELATVFDGIVK